jgi:hypothetical protein
VELLEMDAQNQPIKVTRDVIVICEVVEEFWNGTVPYRLVKVYTINAEDAARSEEAGGMRGVPKLGSTFLEAKDVYLKNGSQTYRALEEIAGQTNSTLRLVEEYSKRVLKGGESTVDFIKRQRSVTTEWITLANLYRQAVGDSNFRFYETTSAVDEKRKLKFVNMEVSKKTMWSFGLNLSTENYCAPTVIVNDLYAKIGAKTEFRQLELIASNYVTDRPEAAFCAYEAVIIAYMIKESERKRAQLALSQCKC